MSRGPIPGNPEARCAFFTNWLQEFTPPLATSLGFTPDEQIVITGEIRWIIHACQLASDASTYALACTVWRDRLLDNDTTVAPSGSPPAATTLPPVPPGVPPQPGALDRFRGYIKRVKAAPAYTPAIGQSLRIVSPPPTPVDETSVKPELTARPEANFTNRLRWRRRDFDAVQLQRKVPGRATWEDLGTIIGTNFVDELPTAQPEVPEVNQYRAIFKRGDAPVGQWSDVVTATKQP